MNEEAQGWLEKAHEDLLAARRLAADPAIPGLSAFHAQQAIEKAFKAILVFKQNRLLRTHDLKRLLGEVGGFTLSSDEQDTLEDLNALYIEARYPGDLGLLPSGQPGNEDLVRFQALAERLYEVSRGLIETLGPDQKN
jgi:HEPN domain-containing protein